MESLTLPAKLDCLAQISKYIMELTKEASLEKKTAYKLRLAVDEIATNIISHGYEESGLEGDIKIHGKIENNQVVVILEDTGIPYDPTKKELNQDLDLPLEERQIGGLGVFLALDGVDQFSYQREDNVNRNIFVVNIL
jgi:anti-sigma regulatory factor (Ser/Thr protein kinase)